MVSVEIPKSVGTRRTVGGKINAAGKTVGKTVGNTISKVNKPATRQAPRKTVATTSRKTTTSLSQTTSLVEGLREIPDLYESLDEGLHEHHQAHTKVELPEDVLDDDSDEVRTESNIHIRALYDAISRCTEETDKSTVPEFEDLLRAMQDDTGDDEQCMDIVRQDLLKHCYALFEEVLDLHDNGLKLRKHQYRHLEQGAAFATDRQLTLRNRLEAIEGVLLRNKRVARELFVGGDISLMMVVYLPNVCNEAKTGSARATGSVHTKSSTADLEARLEAAADVRRKTLKHTPDMRRAQFLMDKVFSMGPRERATIFNEMFATEMEEAGVKDRVGTSKWSDALANTYRERKTEKRRSLWEGILADPKDENRKELIERISAAKESLG